MPHDPANPIEPPSPDEEQRIRERAYYLWQADGCPSGRDGEYWERARELEAIASNPQAGELPNPMAENRSPGVEQPIEEAAIQENLGEFPHAGLIDQGDRAEMPMTRTEAERTPIINEKTPDKGETAPMPPRPAPARAATPMPPKRNAAGGAVEPTAKPARSGAGRRKG